MTVTTQKKPTCPECNESKRVILDGCRYPNGEKIQRYLCKNCGFRFSERNVINKTEQRCVYQISALKTKRVKNLVRVEQTEEIGRKARCVTDIKSQLVNFSWYLQKIGRSEATIRTYTNYVKNISKHGDLNDTESIKGVIATHYKDRNTKNLATYSYHAYLKFVGGQWEKPSYKSEHKQVFIPTKAEIQLAINSGKKENIAFTTFLYETGARTNEATRLEWTDINRERKQVNIKSSKNGFARTVTITTELIEMLFSLPKNQNRVFSNRSKNARRSSFRHRMETLSRKHGNPRLLKIHLHTLRHCKALNEYHKTKDLLHVKAVLGHKSINTTMRYVQLYTETFGNLEPQNFISSVASTKEERQQLIESGFEWVGQDNNGLTYFRKLKQTDVV